MSRSADSDGTEPLGIGSGGLTPANHMTGMGINHLTVAKILNHAEHEVIAVHDRHSYDQEKRQALEAWGTHLEKIVTGTQKTTKVVRLRRR